MTGPTSNNHVYLHWGNTSFELEEWICQLPTLPSLGNFNNWSSALGNILGVCVTRWLAAYLVLEQETALVKDIIIFMFEEQIKIKVQ